MADTILKDKQDENTDETDEQTQTSSEETGEQPSERGAASGKEDVTDEGEQQEDRGLESDDEPVEEVDSETLALAKLLQNPTTRSAVLAALAKDVDKKVEDGQTKKQAIKSVKETLAKSLGDDYAFLADSLAPMFDGMLSYISNLEAQLTTKVSQDATREGMATAERFFALNPGAKALEAKMAAKMEQYDPKPGMDPMEYLADIYTMVGGKPVGNSSTKVSTKLAEKAKTRIDRNSTDAAAQRKGTSDVAVAAPKAMSLKEAVLEAQKQLVKK